MGLLSGDRHEEYNIRNMVCLYLYLCIILLTINVWYTSNRHRMMVLPAAGPKKPTLSPACVATGDRRLTSPKVPAESGRWSHGAGHGSIHTHVDRSLNFRFGVWERTIHILQPANTGATRRSM